MTEYTLGTQPKNQKGPLSLIDEKHRGQACSQDAESTRSSQPIVQPNRAELARTAAGMIAAASLISIAQRGAFNIALSGGSTPGPVYELLAADGEIDWSRCNIFLSDERCVPPDHAESNYRLVRETLLDRLPHPPALVARMAGELQPQAAARAYEQTIRETIPADETGIPQFDLILLGMGDDGHTASLFPGSRALQITDRLVAADYVSKFDAFRLTLTYPLLNAGRHVLILVSGASKAATLHSVLHGPHQPHKYPVQGVQPTTGQFRWLVDADAAQSTR